MARGKPKLEAIATMDSSGFQAGIAKANKSLGNLEKTSASMAKQAKLLGAVIWAAVGVIAVKAAKKIIKFGKELTILGQKSLSLKKSFKSLAEAAGTSSKKLLADMKKATKGTIAEIDLLATANRMMLLGLDTSVFDEVMEIARRTAKATGQDINYMVDSLAMGLGRQSKMILDNLGIVFQVSDAYEWYAETLGKTSAQLTESEKRLGFQTYAMKIARENVEKLGEDTLTLAEVGGIFTAKWADLRAFIGERLVEAIQEVVKRFGGWENIMKIVDDFIEGTIKPHIVTFIGKIKELGEKIAGIDYEPFIQAVKDLGSSLGSLATSITKVGSSLDETKSDWQGFLDVMAFLLGVLQKINQFFEIVIDIVKLAAGIIGSVIKDVTTIIGIFIEGWQEGTTFTDKLISGFSELALQSGKIEDIRKKCNDLVDSLGIDLIGAIERFIGIEILPKEIIIDHSFDKVESDFHELQRELKDIKRTVTYSIRTVGELPTGAGWTGLRRYQFGGIIPKTQAILAHGGQMMLTREDQRNLFALIRQPRSSQITYSAPITIQHLSVREEADIRRIAEELENIRILSSRSGGVR